MSGAREAYLKELAAGGEISVAVRVAQSGENFRGSCPGKLVIGPHHLVIDPAPPCRNRIDMTGGQVLVAARNEFVGAELQAFHVTIQSPQGAVQNFCMAPNEGGRETTDWLVRALAMSNRP